MWQIAVDPSFRWHDRVPQNQATTKNLHQYHIHNIMPEAQPTPPENSGSYNSTKILEIKLQNTSI